MFHSIQFYHGPCQEERIYFTWIDELPQSCLIVFLETLIMFRHYAVRAKKG